MTLTHYEVAFRKLAWRAGFATFVVAAAVGLSGKTSQALTVHSLAAGNVAGTDVGTCVGSSLANSRFYKYTTNDFSLQDGFILRLVDARGNIIMSVGLTTDSFPDTANIVNELAPIGFSSLSTDSVVPPVSRPFKWQIMESTSSTHPLAPASLLAETTPFDPVAAPHNVASCASLPLALAGEEAAALINRRIRMLADSGPDLYRFHERFNGTTNGDANGASNGPLNFAVAPDLGSGSFATSLSRFANAFEAQGEPLPDSVMAYADPDGGMPHRPNATDIWIEGRYSRYSDALAGADRAGQFAIAHLGIDRLIGENVLVGLMATVDYMMESSTALTSTANGVGWMAGPYASVKLGPNLYFDLRGAWGQSSNNITVATDPGVFNTDRWLVKGDLTGSFDHGPWHVGPTIGVIYVEEQQKAYTTTGGTAVPAQTAMLGRLRFGPTIAYSHALENGGTVTPTFTAIGLWDFASSGPVMLGGVTASSSNLSATLKAGINTRSRSGASLGLEAIYGGLFASEFEAWGGRATVNIPLN